MSAMVLQKPTVEEKQIIDKVVSDIETALAKLKPGVCHNIGRADYPELAELSRHGTAESGGLAYGVSRKQLQVQYDAVGGFYVARLGGPEQDKRFFQFGKSRWKEPENNSHFTPPNDIQLRSFRRDGDRNAEGVSEVRLPPGGRLVINLGNGRVATVTLPINQHEKASHEGEGKEIASRGIVKQPLESFLHWMEPSTKYILGRGRDGQEFSVGTERTLVSSRHAESWFSNRQGLYGITCLHDNGLQYEGFDGKWHELKLGETIYLREGRELKFPDGTKVSMPLREQPEGDGMLLVSGPVRRR